MTQLSIKTSDSSKHDSVKGVIDSALRREQELLSSSLERTKAKLTEFEKKYSLSSEEFYGKFQSGTLGDSDDYIDWFGEFQLYQILSEKYSLLKDIVVVNQ